MAYESLKEFTCSCIQSAEISMAEFKEHGFIKLDKLNDIMWAFIFCMKDDCETGVLGHYPLLTSNINNLNEFLTYIHENKINFVLSSKLDSTNLSSNDFRQIDVYRTGDNIYTEAFTNAGAGDTDGNPSTEIRYSGCYNEVYCDNLSEQEIEIFKKGVLSERERIFDLIGEINIFQR